MTQISEVTALNVEYFSNARIAAGNVSMFAQTNNYPNAQFGLTISGHTAGSGVGTATATFAPYINPSTSNRMIKLLFNEGYIGYNNANVLGWQGNDRPFKERFYVRVTDTSPTVANGQLCTNLGTLQPSNAHTLSATPAVTAKDITTFANIPSEWTMMLPANQGLAILYQVQYDAANSTGTLNAQGALTILIDDMQT